MEAIDQASVWDRALLIVVAAVAAYAFVLVVAGLWLGDTVFDLLSFGPEDGNIENAQREYVQLLYGVLGAVIVGWMATIAAIVVGPLRRRESWAWRAVVISVTIWFVLDTGLSLVLGFIGHALFNVAFAIGLAVPLAAIRADLREN
jgi:hypothetical protein